MSHSTQPPTPEPTTRSGSELFNTAGHLPKEVSDAEVQLKELDEISLNSSVTHPDSSHEEEIQYFHQTNPSSSSSSHSSKKCSLSDVTPQDFLGIVNEVREAIKIGKLPVRIHQGSSGSYFCQDASLRTLAVFKPKDEEPYGHLNPKWTKWIHRNLFPCCFGRSSLIPNVGYLSEASASLIDRQLKLGLVPRTEIVKLASASFYYSRRTLSASLRSEGEVPLPLKIGSFQLFLDGFENASTFLTRHPWPTSCALDIHHVKSKSRSHSVDHPTVDDDTLPMLANDHSQKNIWTVSRQHQFRLELEKLVLFDYLIRNTDRLMVNLDRGPDNWMIKLTGDNTIAIAAIDHGLAFPHKHPDNWRSYPYGWLKLPASLIDRPFSESTRVQFLAILTSKSWWQNTELLLTKMNHLDPDFNKKMFDHQLQVLRGQAWNLVECLKTANEGPLELCRRPPVVVLEQEEGDIDAEALGAELPSVSPPSTAALEPPSKTYQGVSPLTPSTSWPDPFLDHEISSDTTTRKKVIRKLKTLTSKPWFASC